MDSKFGIDTKIPTPYEEKDLYEGYKNLDIENFSLSDLLVPEFNILCEALQDEEDLAEIQSLIFQMSKLFSSDEKMCNDLFLIESFCLDGEVDLIKAKQEIKKIQKDFNKENKQKDLFQNLSLEQILELKIIVVYNSILKSINNFLDNFQKAFKNQSDENLKNWDQTKRKYLNVREKYSGFIPINKKVSIFDKDGYLLFLAYFEHEMNNKINLLYSFDGGEMSSKSQNFFSSNYQKTKIFLNLFPNEIEIIEDVIVDSREEFLNNSSLESIYLSSTNCNYKLINKRNNNFKISDNPLYFALLFGELENNYQKYGKEGKNLLIINEDNYEIICENKKKTEEEIGEVTSTEKGIGEDGVIQTMANNLSIKKKAEVVIDNNEETFEIRIKIFGKQTEE